MIKGSCSVHAERAAGAGLVSVSTTHTGLFFSSEPVLKILADHCIVIDPQESRVRRLRKGVGVAAKWIHNTSGAPGQKVMVTLTYSGTNADWRPTHMTAYVTCVRNWYSRLTGDKLRYVWVAELQERGVIHYHAVFWLRKGVTMPKADKRGWWVHGMTRTEKASKPVAYLMSYLSKIETKNVCQFPAGARLFGVGGLDKTGADIKRWVLWPSYVQGNAAAGDGFRPSAGGGYVNDSTGEYLASEFVPVGTSHRTFMRVRHVPRQVDASGPFSWFSAAPGSAGMLH